MNWMRKGLFITLAVTLGGYVLLCLGLYGWGLQSRPDSFRTPPSVLPAAVVEQLAALEGVDQQAMPRLDPITLLPRWWLATRSHDRRSNWFDTLGTLSRFRGYRFGEQRNGTRRFFSQLADMIYLSRHWNREQVLSARAGYANYGRDARDLNAAAHAWFERPLADLQAQEIVALWVLQHGSTYWDPFCHRDRFAQRYALLASRVQGVKPDDFQSALPRMKATVCR